MSWWFSDDWYGDDYDGGDSDKEIAAKKAKSAAEAAEFVKKQAEFIAQFAEDIPPEEWVKLPSSTPIGVHDFSPLARAIFADVHGENFASENNFFVSAHEIRKEKKTGLFTEYYTDRFVLHIYAQGRRRGEDQLDYRLAFPSVDRVSGTADAPFNPQNLQYVPSVGLIRRGTFNALAEQYRHAVENGLNVSPIPVLYFE